MFSLGLKVKCKKCHCVISEESQGRLCDNCNMDLIAQNLAAELSQHEIHQDNETSDLDNVSGLEEGCQVEANSNDTVDESNVTEVQECTPLKSDSSQADNDSAEHTPLSRSPGGEEGKDSKDDDLELNSDKEPPSGETKKRKYDKIQTVESKTSTSDSPINNESKESKEECSEDEPESKRPELEVKVEPMRTRGKVVHKDSTVMKLDGSCDDITMSVMAEEGIGEVKVEPMRTRAKVVQEEAAAMRLHDGSADDVAMTTSMIEEGEDDEDGGGPVRRLTRKALSEVDRYKHPSYEPVHSKSRRTKTFKAKPVYKAPTSQARIYSSDYVFYKGTYYQMGDVVLLRDSKRPGNFFAQITSFLTDQYCHKCATIQWLFPTKQSPLNSFDPRTYFLGYLDETPRPLAALLPVMNLPSDYYQFNKTPYPPPTPDPLKKYYLWKRTEPVSLEDLQQGSTNN